MTESCSQSLISRRVSFRKQIVETICYNGGAYSTGFDLLG